MYKNSAVILGTHHEQQSYSYRSENAKDLEPLSQGPNKDQTNSYTIHTHIYVYMYVLIGIFV